MGSRRKAREAGLQLLFGLEDVADLDDIKAVDRAVDAFFENFDAAPKTHEYAEHLARGYAKERGSIDELIQKHSPKWKLERMSRVDRNVLRLCTYELLHEEDVPDKVVLDEAIELAKRFGAEASGGFVNGVMDALLKDVRGGEA
jgi:N utilization substance protein B